MRSVVAAAVLSACLGACATLSPVSPPHMKAYELSLGVSGERVAVAWHGSREGLDAIFLQKVNARLEPLGPARQVTDGAQHAFEPDLILFEQDALLAWYEKSPTTGELTAWLTRLDATGREIWRVRLDAEGGSARNPVIRFTDGVIWTAWIETHGAAEPYIWIARFDLDGKPIDVLRRAGLASRDTWNLNAAVSPDGGFHVVYDAKLTSRVSELHVLIADRRGVRHAQLSEDDDFASVYPDLAFSETGQAALTWFDERDGNEEIYLSILPAAQLERGVEGAAQRVSNTAASSIGAYLAWCGGHLTVVWSDAEPGQRELYVRRYDDAGAAQGAAVRLTRTPRQSSIPSIRAWQGECLVAWNEYVAGGAGVHRAILESPAFIKKLERN